MLFARAALTAGMMMSISSVPTFLLHRRADSNHKPRPLIGAAAGRGSLRRQFDRQLNLRLRDVLRHFLERKWVVTSATRNQRPRSSSPATSSRYVRCRPVGTEIRLADEKFAGADDASLLTGAVTSASNSPAQAALCAFL